MGKTKLTRRQFVSTLTTGAGTLMLGKALLASPSQRYNESPDQLKVVSLGKSGLRTTLLGMGTGFSCYNQHSDITRSVSTGSIIRQAYEKGIRFFDCADSYGTHSFIASSLKGFPRESYILASKIWFGQGGIPEPERPDADVVVDRFRKELNTDFLDLVQIHCITDAAWTDKLKKQMDILENLKARKIIRAHGVSVHSLEAMEACSGNPWVDIVHVRINPFGESMDKSDPALVTPVISKLHNEGKGIIGMKLLGAGKFKDDDEKTDQSIKYVFGLGSVDMVISGFAVPCQIDNYIARIRQAVR